jgi:hypothetical protein
MRADGDSIGRALLMAMAQGVQERQRPAGGGEGIPGVVFPPAAGTTTGGPSDHGAAPPPSAAAFGFARRGGGAPAGALGIEAAFAAAGGGGGGGGGARFGLQPGLLPWASRVGGSAAVHGDEYEDPEHAIPAFARAHRDTRYDGTVGYGNGEASGTAGQDTDEDEVMGEAYGEAGPQRRRPLPAAASGKGKEPVYIVLSDDDDKTN